MEKYIYDSFLDILREELVPAMGCTEPIAVAYAAALARDTLGCMPESITFLAGACDCCVSISLILISPFVYFLNPSSA